MAASKRAILRISATAGRDRSVGAPKYSLTSNSAADDHYQLTAVFVLVLTLTDDGLMESISDRFGEGINVVVAVDFDSFAGGIAYDKAVVAPLEVLFQLRSELDINAAVEVLVQFFKEVFALHCGLAPSLLLFLK